MGCGASKDLVERDHLPQEKLRGAIDDVTQRMSVSKQCFETTSNLHPRVSHGAMGAAAVLNGCPVRDDFGGDVCLTIIDPQNDFMEGGSLGVTGAKADLDRVCTLLRDHADSIGRVVVTLDTHHQMHIAHSSFWQQSPPPFTMIAAADIRSGKYSPANPEHAEWALHYATQLEAQGKFTIIIWPEHCLVGSPGHTLYAPLAEALHAWSSKRTRTVTWVLKGQNNLTEMYSALRAEVVRDDDPSTRLNQQLITALGLHSKVVVCGQAKSHCVNYTLRDLLSGWPKGREADLVLLDDGCSPVSGYEKHADLLVTDMKAAGVTVIKCGEASIIMPPAKG